MLSKKYRLSRKDINLIYKKGTGQKYGPLGLKVLDRQRDIPRFAVTVPIKTLKKAAARNRLRRLVYDEIGKILKEKKVISRDYVLRFYTAPLESEVRALIRKAIQR